MNPKEKSAQESTSSPTPEERTTAMSPIGVNIETDDDDVKPDVDLSSPGSSCSEPVYERQPGFRYHGQDRKYVKTTLVNGKKVKQRQEVGRGDDGVGKGCYRTRLWRKEPLPMKLRALPQSFWQQPNNTNCLSPGVVCPSLPPLPSLDRLDSLPGASGSTSTSQASSASTVATTSEVATSRHHRVTSSADTELLFSLFRGVEAGLEPKQARPAVVKRGRPRKNPAAHVQTRVLRDDDPYLAGAGAESILPILPNRSGSKQAGKGRQVLAMVSLKDGDKTVSLPSLNVQHNYSQILSDLVINL